MADGLQSLLGTIRVSKVNRDVRGKQLGKDSDLEEAAAFIVRTNLGDRQNDSGSGLVIQVQRQGPVSAREHGFKCDATVRAGHWHHASECASDQYGDEVQIGEARAVAA